MTPTPARRRLRRALVREAALVGLVGLAVAILGGALGLLARPEALAAGVRFVLGLLVTSAGTSLSAVVPGAITVGCFVVVSRWRRNGALAGLAQLGVGPRDLLRSALPILLALSVVGGLLVHLAEPLAWTAVHHLKGSPAASAAALGRLAGGEAVALNDGRIVAAPTTTGLALRARGWSGTAARLSATPDGWAVEQLHVAGPASRWTVRAALLRPVDAATPPSNPLTFGALRLLDDGGSRAALVLHRRMALPVLGLLLGLCALQLGGRPRFGALALIGLALSTFALVRATDGWARAGDMPPWIAGWLPPTIVAVVALLLWRRR